LTGQLAAVDWTADRLRLTSWQTLTVQLVDFDPQAGGRWSTS